MADDGQRAPAAVLPLTSAVLHIMLTLADGEKHGYAIMQEVEANTGGVIHMGPGTLYGSLQRMLKDGLIAEAPEHVLAGGAERRRYYRLTVFGQQVLRAEAQRLEQLVRLAQHKQVLPELGGAS